MNSPALLLAATLFALSLGAASLSNVAGTGTAGSDGDGGPAIRATLDNPFGVVRGPDRALWFADYAAHVVRRIAPDGTIATVVGREAGLEHPHEIRFDRDGSLFIADTDHHVVRRVDARTRAVTTFAGTGKPGYSGDGGPAGQAQFRMPISIQFAPSGDLYIADIGNHAIRRVDAKSLIVTTVAGIGTAGPTPDGSPIRGTALNGPRSLDFDAEGNLWLVTREGNQLLRLDLAKGVVHIAAGTGRKGLTGDGGPAREASLNGPKGIAVGPDGGVYLADTENHVVRRFDPRRGTIERVAGTGERGDGPAGNPLAARLSRPHGVFVEADGSVLIGDSESHRIRVVAAPRAK